MTEDFTKEPAGVIEYLYVVDAMNNALDLAPVNEREQMEETNTAYYSRWHNYWEQLEEERTQRLNAIECRTNELLSPQLQKIEEIKSAIAKKTAKVEKLEKTGKRVPLVAFLALGLLLFILFCISGAEGGTGALFFLSALVSCVFVFLPLKLAFFFICKAVRVPTDLMINHSYNQIGQIEKVIQEQKEQLDNETHMVMIDTGWIDR